MWVHVRAWLFPVWCIGCGKPDVALCGECAPLAAPQKHVRDELTVHAAYAYAGIVREAIVAMKRGERAYLDALGALVAPAVERGCVLVPVPTTRRRIAERGFDQTRELARRIGHIRGAHVADVLAKQGAAQRGLGRLARLGARGRFHVRPGAIVPPDAVLFDDVLTTGATLRDAAATLLCGRLHGALRGRRGAGGAGRRNSGASPIVNRSVKAIWNGTVLAESDKTEVVEGNQYFPPDSIKRQYFSDSATHSVCPWKGTASYYTVEVDGKKNADAAWYYPTAKAEAKNIEGYVAFWKGVEVAP